MSLVVEGGRYNPPYTWAGGKAAIADTVWRLLGDVPHYIEPFFGGGAVLFLRPETHHSPRREVINDLDGFVANFWRAAKHAPEDVAYWCNNPLNECDYHACRVWLKPQRSVLSARLEGDPDYYDAKIAGRWAWVISAQA